MITGYNFHIQGKRHQARNCPCQDYSIIYNITPSWKIAAVADGVSSSEKSEIASKMACEVACSYIEKAFPYDDFYAEFLEQDIEAVIRSAMHAAANAIEEYADDNNLPRRYFDTTLVLVLYNGESVYAGYVGDSGLVLLMDNGDMKFSVPMKDDQGHVYPLRFRKAYSTSSIAGVAAVYCTTDGLYHDAFYQNGERSKDAADQFIPYSAFTHNDESVCDYIDKFRERAIKVCEEHKGLTDDISVSLLLNTEKKIEKHERQSIDLVSQLLTTVSVYDESIRRKAFRNNIRAYYPELLEEDIDALFDGEMDLTTALGNASSKTIEKEETAEITTEPNESEVVDQIEEDDFTEDKPCIGETDKNCSAEQDCFNDEKKND